MYTGIVQACVPVVRVESKPGLKTYAVEIPEPLVAGLELGASVSIDGVCQTVVRIDGAQVTFDAMEETLHKTTIGTMGEGRQVNVERSATSGDEIGGHALAGHVSGTAEIVAVHAIAGWPPRPDDLTAINRELQIARAHERLIASPHGIVLEYGDTASALDSVLWPVVRSAGELLTSSRLERVGQCPGDECGYSSIPAGPAAGSGVT